MIKYSEKFSEIKDFPIYLIFITSILKFVSSTINNDLSVYERFKKIKNGMFELIFYNNIKYIYLIYS